MKALFKMDFDCGRMGNLEGVFIANTLKYPGVWLKVKSNK